MAIDLEILKATLSDTANREWSPSILPTTTQAVTCMPPSHLDNLEWACKYVIRNGIVGSFMECGVWKGGGLILMKAIIENFRSQRSVFGADSFRGLPIPSEDYPADAGSVWHPGILREGGHGEWLVQGTEVVRESFRRANVPMTDVYLIEGYFSELANKGDQLPNSIAVLHLDGDMYQSTYECLEELYPRVVIGGIVIEDDYLNPGFSTSQQAVVDYLRAIKRPENIRPVPGQHAYAAYWIKGGIAV